MVILVWYVYIYIYINIHSYEGDIMVLFGRIYNITVRYGSHGPFNLIKTMMYRLIECWISILWMCNRKIITNHPCLMKVSSPALITHIYLYREPAIITAPKINHWTMGATGVIIQPIEVINSHPISSHIIPYLQMGTHIPWFHHQNCSCIASKTHKSIAFTPI